MAGRRSGGGRAGRQAARLAKVIESVPFLTRSISPFELLTDESLSLIEYNADKLLTEVGVQIDNYPEALQVFAEAGADVDGTRVRFPTGMCRQLIQASAPAQFTQLARNSERSVVIGDPHLVFAPAYGSPFVRDLEGGRRYATFDDFQNFAKLAQMSPSLHHGGGTLCEPVNLPVDTRHLDMVLAHLTVHDKPFMGSVTEPARAQDTVDMAKIAFGAETVDTNTVIVSLCNANSPMCWDYAMLGSAKVYAENNQACIITPFILAGAMSPVTVAGTATQTLAEAMAGMAFCQIVRPGAPVVFGSFASSMSMRSGAPTFGTPEPAAVIFVVAALARRLGVPFRTGGNLTSSKVADYQAAYESSATFGPTVLAGTNFVLHSAGWLEGGLVMGYEKFALDVDQIDAARRFVSGVDMSQNGQAMDAMLDNPPGQHHLGSGHTLSNFETAFWRSQLADDNSFEQWSAEGALTSEDRANQLWRSKLENYEKPPIDASVEAELSEWVARRKIELSSPPEAGGRDGVQRRMSTLPRLDVDHLTTAQIDAIRRCLEAPKYELVPLKGALGCSRHLPDGATVDVTASASKGMTPTVDLAVELQKRGFDVIPHLSARITSDRAELERVLDRLTGAGITKAFVIGGDADGYGEFFDALALLTAMDTIDHGIVEIGIAGYPEGHHIVDDATIDRAVAAKAPFAEYLTTQMCFSPEAVSTWVDRVRRQGIDLGVYIGIPGVAELRKLLALSLRIGVGPSTRFLEHSKGVVGRLARPGGYTPDDLIIGLAPLLADPAAKIAGLHIYSFNQVETTEQWRQEMLERL